MYSHLIFRYVYIFNNNHLCNCMWHKINLQLVIYKHHIMGYVHATVYPLHTMPRGLMLCWTRCTWERTVSLSHRHCVRVTHYFQLGGSIAGLVPPRKAMDSRPTRIRRNLLSRSCSKEGRCFIIRSRRQYLPFTLCSFPSAYVLTLLFDHMIEISGIVGASPARGEVRQSYKHFSVCTLL